MARRKEKKIKARREKLARKAERYKRNGGTSRYALKRSGEIAPNLGSGPVFCGNCYCRFCICHLHRSERAAREPYDDFASQGGPYDAQW